MYDADALVADVGGYLGLLLGHSVYSVMVTLSEWLRNVKGYKARLNRFGSIKAN